MLPLAPSSRSAARSRDWSPLQPSRPRRGDGLRVVLASFLLNFLAQFRAPAKAVQFLGVLSCDAPAQISQPGRFRLVTR
jgi:hypothetical protein